MTSEELRRLTELNDKIKKLNEIIESKDDYSKIQLLEKQSWYFDEEWILKTEISLDDFPDFSELLVKCCEDKIKKLVEEIKKCTNAI